MRRATLSPSRLAAFGWKKWNGGEYRHSTGWRVLHCGHPTAIHPYLLTDPKDRIVCTGAMVSGRADFGTAWDTLKDAVEFVARHLAGDAPFTGPYRPFGCGQLPLQAVQS